MRKGDARKYLPEASIGRPSFFSEHYPTAVRDWKCELCGEIIPKGTRYLRYIHRMPLEIDDCPFHPICYAVIKAYCKEKHRTRFLKGWVLRWAKETYCKRCRIQTEDCRICDCRKVARLSGYRKQKIPWENS